MARPLIILGTDHAGYVLKEKVKAFLIRAGYRVRDMGTHSERDVDYPDFIFPAARAVAKTRGTRGIVFGGSGLGECIAANKVRGIRAVAAYDAYTAKMSRLHNDANVLCLGGRTVTKDPKRAIAIVKLWLATPFSGDARHVRRLKKIALYESSKGYKGV